MTTLSLPLREPWANLPVGDEKTLDGLLADIPAGATAEARTWFEQLLGLLERAGVESLSALVIPDADDPAGVALAWCVIGFLSSDTDEAALAAIAAAGWPAEGQPEVMIMASPAGEMMRAVDLRAQVELLQWDGTCPVFLRARYVLPMGSDLVAVVQFESPSLGYEAEWTTMFDTIMSGAELA